MLYIMLHMRIIITYFNIIILKLHVSHNIYIYTFVFKIHFQYKILKLNMSSILLSKIK